ncbi:MAG: T9SS type A sorting domain-containing protein [Bacteroidota bacterium]
MRFKLTLLLSISLLAQQAAFSATPTNDRKAILMEARARMQARLISASTSTGLPHSQSSMPPFYLEDFSSGLPSNWSNIDSAGSGRRWLHSNNACGQCDALYIGTGIDSLSVIGTSSANGIVMYDSDSAGTSIGGDYGVLTSPPINCTGLSAVQLSFNELFIFCNDQVNAAFPNTARVYVSNNNVNWTLVHAADAGLAACGDFTPNPTAVSVDISGIAANQSTVYIRFSFTGDYSYWWFLDDVALTQPSPYEAELVSIQPITNGCSLTNNEAISITIRNNGYQTISNFPVSYSINGGAPIVETITNPLPPNILLNYTFNQRADFSFPGSYTIVAAVNLSNDTYAPNDNDTIQAVCTLPATPFHYSNGMESAIDYDGCIVWDFDGDGGRPVRVGSGAHSGNYSLHFPSSSSGTTYDKWLFLPCMDLVSGQDYLVDFWTAYSSTANAGSLQAYLCNGADPADTILSFQNCTSGPTTGYARQSCSFAAPQSATYHIALRYSGYNVQSALNLDDIGIDLTVGIGETSGPALPVIHPNPNNGQFFVLPGGSLQPYELLVTDAFGKIIFSKVCSGSQAEQIELVDISSGIYFARMTSEGNSRVQRISVSK